MARRTADLASMATLVDSIVGDVVKAAREEVRDLYHGIGSRFVREMPKQTGRAKGSIRPYVGDPSEWMPEHGAPFYPTVGATDFDFAVDRWRPGVELGFESNIPYATRLANGWSPQAAAGWIGILVREEVAKATR